MQDPELDVLIKELESHTNMTIAEFDAVAHALAFLLPSKVLEGVTPQRLATSDGALHLADDLYPNWAVHIHGRANDHDGHWRCTLREADNRDTNVTRAQGRSPVLVQAILAAVLRLSMLQKAKSDAD